MSATTTDIDASLLDDIRAFRLSKGTSKTAALVVKIDKKRLVIEKEELLDPITPDDLAEELPEHSPRFVVLSFAHTHDDGRVSYPLVLLHWAPQSSSIELATLYASALAQFSAAADVGRTIDVRDGELSTAALVARLGGK
ncbi:hypothetical protein MCUN1_003550 [Malassezia cuniculi]|uniref:ADF-H domain-containing protein n=1 Tax=Malassezia cuniculi TaxID=948313 RepID=A0AAF0ETC5_9BASI|nr:hypothetical protein MCUN1_003550 [Malassezia cuniculi]